MFVDKFVKVSHEFDPNLPLGQQVYELLKQRIVQARFQPGERASEVELSRQLQVSRQPVRDAFQRLQTEGLLDIRPQRGTFVQKISIKAVLDARFLREAIEADIVELVATSRDPGVINELRKQIKAQRKVIKDEPLSFMKLDDLFHRTLAEAANKSNAWQVVEDLKTQMDRVRFLSFNHFHVEQLIAQHESIVDAIESGSTTDAVRYIRKHLREILKSLPTISQEYPDFFSPASEELADTSSIININ